MKKILGLLALAPLTIASCTEGDGGAGGKSMLTHLTSENTQEEIELYVDTYFGVEHDWDLVCWDEAEFEWEETWGYGFDFYETNTQGGVEHTIVYTMGDWDAFRGWDVYEDPKGHFKLGTILERVSQKLHTYDWCE